MTNEIDPCDQRPRAAAIPKIAEAHAHVVLERAEAERRDPVAELVRGDEQAGQRGADPARSRWPKLIVSGSSAEQPRPARPNTSTPSVESPDGSNETSSQCHRGHERQQPVGLRLREPPLDGGEEDAPERHHRPEVVSVRDASAPTRRGSRS